MTESEPAASPLPTAAIPAPTADHHLWFHLHRSRFSGGQTVLDKTILAVVKLLRLPLAVPPDFPCVATLAPFAVDPATLSAEMRSAIAAPLGRLRALGFGEPLVHLVRQPLLSCEMLYLSLPHAGGRAFARLSVVFHAMRQTPLSFVQFYSLSPGSGVMLTWGRGMDLATPSGWEVETRRGCDEAALWAVHQERLRSRSPRTLAPADLPAAVEAIQQELAGHQLACGVMRPYYEIERQRHVAMCRAAAGRAAGPAPEHPEVQAEIARLQVATQGGWGSFLLILVVSLGLFLASMGAQNGFDWAFLGMLVGVLLFHESGHYLAMRLSGYRNLKMFFIPFLGAAVSGQSYNVAGWKKTVVSLAGPVPGIALGIVLTIVGLVAGEPALLKLSLLLLVINGLNLLPILPLDGGWVAHQLLFSRHPWLDLVFRIFAVLGLLALSLALETKVLMFVAIFLAIGIPMAFGLARITAELRRSGFASRSEDDQTIPPEAADPIITRVKAAHPKGLTPRLTAQHTIAIFDSLNSHPPGWIVSGLFLGLHVAALVLAIGCGAVAAVGMHGGMPAVRMVFNRWTPGLAGPGQALQLPNQVDVGSIITIAAPPRDAAPAVVLVATVKDHAAAGALARSLVPGLPPGSGCLVFGDSVLASLAEDDPAIRERVYRTLASADQDAFACTAGDLVGLMLSTASRGADEAGQLIGDYFACPDADGLLPPWAEADPRTPLQQAADALHRRLCVRITEAGHAGMDTPRGRALAMEALAANRRGDKARMAAIGHEQQLLNREAFLAALDGLEREQPEAGAMLAACRSLAPLLGTKGFGPAFAAAVRPHLGPADDAGGRLAGAAFGYCFTAADFADSDADGEAAPARPAPADRPFEMTMHCTAPASAFPALVRWLGRHGYRDLRYRLDHIPQFTPGEEPE
jgi:Zn-dependent protease